MADGSVIIDTKMDTSGVEKGAEDIADSLKSMLGYMQSISSNVDKIVNGLASGSNTAGKAVENLNGDLEETAQASKRAIKEISKFDPSDVSGLTIHRWNDNSDLIGDTSEISDEERQAMHERVKDRLKAAQEEADAFNAEEEKVNELYESIKKLKEELKSLEKSGQWWGDEEYDKAAVKLNELNKQAQEYKNNKLSPEIESTADSVGRLGERVDSLSKKLMSSGISGLKNKIKSLGKAIDRIMTKLLKLGSNAVLSGIQKISAGIFGINKSANKSTLSISKLLKYIFGIRSLFVLFNKLRSAIVDGFNNLAKYDLATQTGDVNNSLSALMSALTKLKNSFATAFAPLLTTVSPILVSFINLLSEAVTRVGMLIAALTGKDTFTKAIGVQENYAASLDKSAQNANKAKKATKGYLSSLDEIKRYDDGSSNDSSGSGGNSYTGPSASDMFETVPIESSIKDVADKIKKYIESQDWEGLGSYMADGINKGLEKVYNVINWDNVGPKITPFITAFTTTFNSLVDNINWELMGKTVGAGINTIVNALSLAITGIDWYNLGKKFAKGIKGLVKEVDWNGLGQLIGNKFMASWRVFGGFVKNLPYRDIGRAVATALNGVFKTINLSEIGNYLATALNGAFTSLYTFATTFDWTQMVDNIAGGINTFVADFDWKGNGEKLEVFLEKLCSALVDFAETTDWESVGNGIGTFLSQVDWKGHLKQVIDAIKTAIGGLFDGLEASGTAGKIASFLLKAFIAVDIANKLGISDFVKSVVGFIGTKLIGTESVGALSGKLTTLVGNAASGAAGSFSGLATSLAPLVGTAGLIVGVGTAAAGAASELAKLVESMQGGNGIGTTFGNTMNNFIQTLQRRGDILSGSAEEIWQLKESLEQEGMTAEEKASATQKLIDKLGEMGVTSDQAKQAFSSLYQQGLITDDMFGILSDSIKTLDDNTTNVKGSLDLSKQSLDDIADNVLPALQTQLNLSADQVTSLDTALLETENSGGTAQDAFNNIIARAQELGINTESVAKIFAQTFPDAVKETESSTKTSMENTQKSVKDGMGAASVAVGSAMAGIQKDTETSMSAAETAVSDHTSNISRDSETNWAAAEGFATGSVEEVGKTTYEKMRAVYGVITRYNNSIKDDFDKKWGSAKKTVVSAVQNMSSRVADNCSTMATGVENAFSGIPDYISGIMKNAVGKVNTVVSNINSTIGNIERGFTFSYDVQLPNGGRRWGNYSLNLPRVSTIPYLATGAVIPPRSEFLAVLGDQKNGKNLEAPEGLLRQIIREETGGQQTNGNLRLTIQLNRRTIFDEVMEEAKLRRDASGMNPFDLA